MFTLNVKVKVIKCHIEAQNAEKVLMENVHEVRSYENSDELIMYEKDRNNNGYMHNFAKLKLSDIAEGDLKRVLELDFYKRGEKAEACRILAKYAKHFDSEYGVCTEVRDET